MITLAHWEGKKKPGAPNGQSAPGYNWYIQTVLWYIKNKRVESLQINLTKAEVDKLLDAKVPQIQWSTEPYLKI